MLGYCQGLETHIEHQMVTVIVLKASQTLLLLVHPSLEIPPVRIVHNVVH